ncbi:MAG TPA: hypothetical protein VHG93_22015 [Longimicrobium sp.]|nr:hypothetical protein [Longimicrobium sp.]
MLRRLLWIDCTAGALAGVLVLTLSPWLSRLYALPQVLLLFVGATNLLYASFSFSLARRAERPMSLIKLLVFANAAWVPVCLGLAATFWNRATVFGIAQLIGEAVFVGGLAALEWKLRHQLTTGAVRVSGVPGARLEGA